MIDPAYLKPARFIESEAPEIVAFARAAAGDASEPLEVARRLYYAVRDQVIYDPYQNFSQLEIYSARATLLRKRGYCVAKAALLTACCRAMCIPARIGFADVKNHLATGWLLEINGSDVFTWHAYADIWLEGKFVKATPAFNLSMCERFGVLPLEFDGRTDSVFHPFDAHDRRHMEYVNDRGTFADVPAERIIETVRQECPRFLDAATFSGRDFGGDAKA